MQLPKNKFDSKKVEQFLINEDKFITDLFSMTAIPERKAFDQISEEDGRPHNSVPDIKGKKTSRAKSLQELQQRLESIISKKKLTYKEKLVKKGLKNRMKKKTKQDERNAKQKLIRAAKLTVKTEIDDENVITDKPVKTAAFNREEKMVFSKVNFSNLGKKRNQKPDNNPKKLLQKLEDDKEKILKLEESGGAKKAMEIKEQTAWKNALAKAEGKKIKDDPTLLKKSVKKKEQKKRSNKKKWKNRIQGVEKAKEEKQNKRLENIEKRKKEKRNKKLKKASKKGKIIPGF